MHVVYSGAAAKMHGARGAAERKKVVHAVIKVFNVQADVYVELKRQIAKTSPWNKKQLHA